MAAAAIENADRPDLKALKDAKDAAERRLRLPMASWPAPTARVQLLEKLAGEISTEIAWLDRLEQETGPLRARRCLHRPQ